MRSPTFNHPGFPLPELVADHSNNASDDDQVMDMDQDMPDSSSAIGPPSPAGGYAQDSYSYGAGGSGGFGFGPGAEEDEFEMDMMDDMGTIQMKSEHLSSTLKLDLTAWDQTTHLSPLTLILTIFPTLGTTPIFGVRHPLPRSLSVPLSLHLQHAASSSRQCRPLLLPVHRISRRLGLNTALGAKVFPNSS